jgi:hypothetical protein
MSTAAIVGVGGLRTAPNPLEADGGDLVVASNVWPRYAGVLEPRPGIRDLATFGASSDRAATIAAWAARGWVLFQYGTTVAYVDAGTVTTIATGMPTLTDRAAWALGAGNMYLGYGYHSSGGTKGIYRLSGSAATLAGVPRMADPHASSGGVTGASGFMPNNSQAAWRACLAIRDTVTGALRVGAPSGSKTVINTAGATRDVTTRWMFPRTVAGAVDVTTSHVIQVFRTLTTGGAAVVPGDDYYQIGEYAVAAGDITNGYLDVTDRTPDSFLREPLYTNPNSGDGPLAGRERPPDGVRDLVEWDSRLWAVGPVRGATLSVQLLGVGAPDGLVANDTITIGGTAYTAKAAPATATEFEVYTAGTASQNVERTAQQLARVVTANGAGYAAFYQSGANGAPGGVLLRALSLSSVAVSVSRATAWAPAMGATLTAPLDTSESGLEYSLPGQPEAWPITNRLLVGTQKTRVQRAVALRDKLYVFLDGAGVWTVSGSAPYYRLDELDSTAVLLARDSVVVHAGRIFALTTQGVVAISDAGVEIVSEDIADQLREYLVFGAGDNAGAFAVSNEPEDRFELWVTASPTDVFGTAATICFAYNSKLRRWVKWTGSRTCGVYLPRASGEGSTTQPSLVAYYGNGDDGRGLSQNLIVRDRRAQSAADFRDRSFAGTVTGTPVFVSAALGALMTVDVALGVVVAAGDVIEQDTIYGNLKAVVRSVRAVVLNNGGVDSYNVYVHAALAMTTGGCTVSVGFASSVRFAQQALEQGARKQFTGVQWRLRDVVVRSAGALVSSSQAGPDEASQAYATPGWGAQPWGQHPFGQTSPAVTTVQREAQGGRAVGEWIQAGFDCHEAYANWELLGYSPLYESTSDRVAR